MARYEVFKIKDGAYEIMDNAIGLPLTAHGVCDLLNACELPAVSQPRAMTAVEIAKKYGKGGYAITIFHDRQHATTMFSTALPINGICLIDDLCEDVSKSPWFMPMVDESGNVTEVKG